MPDEIQENPQAEKFETEAPLSALEPELSFKELIKKLIELQARDAVMDGFRSRLEEIDKTIIAIKDGLAREEQEFQTSKETRKQLLVEQKHLEMEISKIDADIAKHTAELGQIKTNDAYRALVTQIGALKAKKDEFETKTIELYDRIDLDKKREKEGLQALELKKKEQGVRISALEQERSGVGTDLAGQEGRRADLVKGLPHDNLERYEHLRARKNGMALAAILEGSSCGGCRMHATQEVINEILKAKDFVVCERCQRILYLP
ncbi:MAG: hypothetical protein HY747_03615 [Elusimicrobia bacterium]|nr:hypothetical protein [Elusimicrobiota bacterium]